MELYRHGDVLIAAVDLIPGDAHKRNDLVLAYGEITGHAHRVEPGYLAELYEVEDVLFLEVVGSPARVVHEEHKAIELKPGLYRIWRQREYDPAVWSRVVED